MVDSSHNQLQIRAVAGLWHTPKALNLKVAGRERLPSGANQFFFKGCTCSISKLAVDHWQLKDALIAAGSKFDIESLWPPSL